MALPFNEMKKPQTAPKPQGISIVSPESRGNVSTSRKLISDHQKSKPPLLPKPVLQSKPTLSAKPAVINSNNICTDNDSNFKHQDRINLPNSETCSTKNTSIRENNVKTHFISDKNCIISNVAHVFQNNIEESIKSEDKIFHADHQNVIVDNNCNSRSESKSVITKSVNISKLREKCVNETFDSSKIFFEKQTSSNSTTLESSNQLLISNTDLKSKIGKFEKIQSYTKELHPNNNDSSKKRTYNATLCNFSETNKSLYGAQEQSQQGKKHDIRTVPVNNSSDFKESTEFSQKAHEKKESSSVKSSTDKTIYKYVENIENSSKSSIISKEANHKQIYDDKVSTHPNIQQKENYLEDSRDSHLLKQNVFSSNRTIIPSAEPSFLHRNTSESLISFTNNHTNHVVDSKKESNSIIERKKALFGRISDEILAENMTPTKSDIGLLKKKHFSDELWKTKSLGPTMSDVTNERRWSMSSLKEEGYSQSYFTDMFNQIKSPILNGNDTFRNELNNKLKRLSISKLDDPEKMLQSKLCDSESPKDSTDNGKYDDSEEPIYWEIEDILPNNNLRITTDNNNLLALPSQINSHIQEEEDFPSDLSDLSDNSDMSHSSWSDVEDSPAPLRSSTLHSLVKATLNLTDNIVQSNISVTSNDSSRNLDKSVHSNVLKISNSKSSRVRRSASDRSTRSRQEDVESIGSNSTEGSYSMSKRLSSWFGSFGKGNKRSSLFYCESSPDQSLLDNTYSNFPHEASKNNDVNFTVEPEYVKIEEIKPISIEEQSEKRKRKAFLVAQEIMTSEKVFVDVLSLLCKDMKKQCLSDIPETELEKIITPLPQLLCLNEDILKDVRDRINHWETLPKISDIFVKKGPFLKLYSSYIQNFEAQCNFFDECCVKYLLFNKKVKEFELSDFCKKLSVKHYMLKPIQRIPQYRLLLEDYLKYLEPESIDYEDTQKALQIVRNVADHANKSMKQGDHLCKLLQIQSQLGNYELIKPGRVFLKEGELLKLSRRGGLQERFIILLSDCLLYTSYYGTMTGLRVNYELPLKGMKVCLPQTEDYNNEFNIITVTRSFTLCARTDSERHEWIEALESAIKENQEHLLSFVNRELETQHSASEIMLGKVAPLWITDSRVSMCQQCTALFTVTFRRHHCRACGRVVCGPCSDYEAPLQYQKFKNSRVCEECFQYLVKEFDDPSKNMFDRIKSVLNIEEEQEVKQTLEIIRSNFKRMGTAGSKKHHSKKSRKHVPLRLIEVTANDSGSQMSGWLFTKSGRSWKRCWFVLKEQVLYKYKASEDIAALKSIPILGYDIETLHEQDNFKFIFQLKHQGQDPLLFAVDNEHSYSRWVKAMTGATTLT